MSSAAMHALQLVALLVLGLIAGCDSVVDFEEDGDRRSTHELASATVESDLQLHLITPRAVAAGDSFQVQVVVRNRSGRELTVMTPNACLVRPSIVDEDGESVPFKGSGVLCAAVVTQHTIPVREAEERTFDMQAVLATVEGETLASPGTYVLRAEFSWVTDEEIRRTVIVGELEVRP